MRRWHLSDREKAKIRGLTRRGVRQSVIARTLKITAPTVSKAQRAMGLNTRLIVPEEKIMNLFRAGWAGYKISKHLHVPANRVWETMHKHEFQREDRLGIATPPENIARFVEALKRREDHILRLARKYKVGRCKANRLAHEILGTVQFRPGASKPPLSSNFPQKHHGKADAA
jgi:hypothetical protein